MEQKGELSRSAPSFRQMAAIDSRAHGGVGGTYNFPTVTLIISRKIRVTGSVPSWRPKPTYHASCFRCFEPPKTLLVVSELTDTTESQILAEDFTDGFGLGLIDENIRFQVH
jgi:hypothetical protein